LKKSELNEKKTNFRYRNCPQAISKIARLRFALATSRGILLFSLIKKKLDQEKCIFSMDFKLK